MPKKIKRCDWAGESSLPYIEYHDKEWGVPVWDDRTQFEFLILEITPNEPPGEETERLRGILAPRSGYGSGNSYSRDLS